MCQICIDYAKQLAYVIPRSFEDAPRDDSWDKCPVCKHNKRAHDRRGCGKWLHDINKMCPCENPTTKNNFLKED